MEIEEFKHIKTLYEKNGLDYREYSLTARKYAALTTKYSEFDYSVPLAKVPGINLELGVYKARCLKYLGNNWPHKTWYGFDTFEGIDEIWDVGDKIVDMRVFNINFIPEVPKNVTLIKGLLQDTLEPFIKEKNSAISYLNIDIDVYSAAIYSLKTLNNYLVPGTIIRFDELSDWRFLNFETSSKLKKSAPNNRYTNWKDGEWKALNEWLIDCNREVEPLWRSWHQAAGIRVLV